MKENKKIIQKIETENFIWIVYLFIIGISFVANFYEKKYYTLGDKKAKERYRTLNIFVFSVALIVYLHFLKENYQSFKNLNCLDSENKIRFSSLNYFASILITIAGIILLYIAIYDRELNTEISFN